MTRLVRSIVEKYCMTLDRIDARIENIEMSNHYKRYIVIKLMKHSPEQMVYVTISRTLIRRNWFRRTEYIQACIDDAIKTHFNDNVSEDITKDEIIEKMLAGFKYISDMDGMVGETYMDEWTEAASFTMCQDLANDMLEKYGKGGCDNDK